jgi:hypothetical protein
MDYKFLDKVVAQILSETTIDYEKERVYTPFSTPLSSYSHVLFSFLTTTFPSFSRQYLSVVVPFPYHCRGVYGLNDEEIEYVWEEFSQILKDKINSNGL